MLSDEIKKTITEYTDGMSFPVSIVLNHGKHEKRKELINFLTSVAEASESITFVERDISDNARSPITFAIEAKGEPTGLYFSGIPSGHEFNTFILAILQSGGVEIKLEDRLKDIIGDIPDKLSFEVFVSILCFAGNKCLSY